MADLYVGASFGIGATSVDVGSDDTRLFLYTISRSGANFDTKINSFRLRIAFHCDTNSWTKLNNCQRGDQQKEMNVS